jgi:hypothetical protein
VSNDLQQFVREALGRGLSREAIRARLADAGWQPDEIAAALGAWAEVDFPVPVPVRRPYLSAREAFLYLILFVTLYVTAFNVGALAFQFVERWLPDPAALPGAPYGAERFAREAVRGAAAALLIAWPVFLALSAYIGRTLQRDPGKRASGVRKWLTYATLFVAALVILGDLTVLVTRLLGGELPPRFLAKVAVVAAIAGYAFVHYLGDLRREEDRPDRAAPARPGWATRLVGAAVLAVLVIGLVLAGSPRTARLQDLDQRRVLALQRIETAIQSHYQDVRALPAALDSLVEVKRLVPAELLDPVTGARFEYVLLDSVRYQLCATFDQPDSLGDRLGHSPERSPRFWSHGAGRTCFRLVVPVAMRGTR